MRFVLTFKPAEQCPANGHAKMAELCARLRAQGVLQSAIGLRGSEAGARVRLAGDRVSVTDGPFAETKELIAGLAIVDVPDRATAVELARQFLAVGGGGESEVREVNDAANF
jgi:hypothetical protein